MQLEFVIGVTGHRDLIPENIDSYRQNINEFLTGYLTAHPGIKFRVISGMAEGADSLVADCVFDLARTYNNIELTAVLPMPKADYEQDFCGAALTQFNARCNEVKKQNWDVVCLPDHTQRDECYANLSHYLANKCDMLLGLWNGNTELEKGGTAYTIKLAQDVRFRIRCLKQIDGLPSSEVEELKGQILDEEQCYVYWIPTKRLKNQHQQLPEKAGFYLGENANLSSENEQLNQHLARLQSFQDDISRHGQLTDYQPCESRFNQPSRDDTRLRRYFSMFDSVANKEQQDVKFAYNCTLWLTLFVSCSFLVFAKLAPSLYILAFHLVLFVSGFIWFINNKPNQKKEKYSLYRALAESLRVEYLYLSGGLLHPLGFGSVANNIHHLGNDKISIVRAIIRQSWLSGNREFSAEAEQVSTSLLVEQRDYFNGAKTKLHSKHTFIEIFVAMTILLPFCVLCSFLFPDLYAFYKTTLFLTIELKTWLVFGCAFLPILGAVVELYAHYHSINELQNQYAKQIKVLNNALAHIQHPQSPMTDPEFYRLIGKIMSTEHLMWLKTTREKQVSTAHGG